MNRFQVMAVTGAVAGMTALSSVGVASAQDAVEWCVQDGGNGHWYRVVSPDYPSRDWYLVKAIAEADGGYLATITSVEENQFLALQPNFAPIDINAESQFWLGGIRIGSQWTWVNGESWRFTSWDSSPSCYEPNAQPDGTGRWLSVHCRRDGALRWNDLSTDLLPDPPHFYLPMGYVVEYSADCNSDGIVDYGQIRAGELVDANANNIPDCCEQGVSCTPCPGDIDESGAVNSVDLAAVLANWGTEGGKYPRADVNSDGFINSSDLAAVLSEWGPCE